MALAVAALRLVLPDSLPFGLAGLNLVLLTLAVADWALAPSPARVGVERTLPAVLTLGEEGAVAWRITNPGSRRWRVALADQLAPSLHPTTRRVDVTVPAKGSTTARAGLKPTRRGRFEPRDVAVRVAGPLGLAARQRTRSLPAVLQVHPPFRSKDEAELRINRARILEIGLRSAPGRGGGTEFEALRDYGPDDEFRRVDWSATARAGRPIVRTYRAERNQAVLVLLDRSRVMAGRVGDATGAGRGADGTVPRLEHAMDAALMLTTVATRLGDRCGLLVFGSSVHTVIEPSRSRAQVGRVTQALYDLEPELAESDYRGAFTATVTRFRRRALLVLLTELSEQASTEFLFPALPLVSRSHVVLVGAVRDPEVERWSRAPVVEADGVYRRAAALSALAERDRVAARLRGFGATVVDAPPGRLAGQLADAYLRLKATGRL